MTLNKGIPKMLTSFKSLLLLLATLVAISTAGPVAAEEWMRATPGGGQISRSVTNDGNGVYSGTTTRTGANGGSYTSSSSCGAGVVTRCSRSYSGVTANGQSFSGQRLSAHGPYSTRSVGSFTGPHGNRYVGFRRIRR
jgi:hypothetical protein